ncbi:MAG: hypothetical protein IT173_03340 [Acidobacteria bacterium]|nr:hypothetical protein [Acidobacteriota bacterium]
MFQFLYRWFLRAAWAPIAVVLVQQIVARFYDIDWLMHFFGGAAMAYFFYQGLRLWELSVGRLLAIVRYLLAFGLTCGVVIAWELTEFTADRLFDTRFQASIPETMGDQLSGVIGAMFILGCIAVVGRVRN